MNDKVIFKRSLGPKGNSVGISIPRELLDYLGATEESNALMTGETINNKRCIVITID